MPKGIVLTPEQQAERREKIVAVALSLMAENGFQKTSMREIAVLANMGKSIRFFQNERRDCCICS